MGRHAVFAVGPAGAGKSTCCAALHEHARMKRRNVQVVNLDPACEAMHVEVAIDVRNLISVDDVAEELEYGPNGALVFCMEYLASHIEWLMEKLNEFGDDCYFIFDCPGQIELYTHFPAMQTICRALSDDGFFVAGMYLVDSLFVAEPSKFIAGILVAMSAMLQLELPWVNILSKCDKLEGYARGGPDCTESEANSNAALLERIVVPSGRELAARVDAEPNGGKYAALSNALATLLDDYSMLSFIPLDITDPDTVDAALQHLDRATQYGDDVEPSGMGFASEGGDQ
jgi:GTPase SAR1 family protein|tara:strand:- start:1228 stop:2085 length:858 start_codon:yes stop_codon:yes gene_type:complete